MGCAQIPESKTEFFQAEPTRLLSENELQGWSLMKAAPPRVGDYDEIFMAEVFRDRANENPTSTPPPSRPSRSQLRIPILSDPRSI